MKSKTIIGATLAGILVGAISYWFQPYNQSTVLGVHMWLVMGIGVFLATFSLTVFLREKPESRAAAVTPALAFFVSIGVVVALIARIIYDTLFVDRTTHNLAPFEILFCLLIATPCAFAGGYLALLLRKFRR